MRHLLAVPLLAAAACGSRESPVFRLLPPDRTGVTFANTIATTDSLNILTDVYVYNGAGAAIGDVDNDGLPDLFLAGNQVTSRLYLNRGDMRFEDITARAGVGTTRWATGVSLADVNGDGWLDVYVSVSGPQWSTPAQRANYLFVNNGDLTFTESAAVYGIADSGFTTHAAFLDYDGDGCLDLFVLNNSPADFSRGDLGGSMVGPGRGHEAAGGENHLYHNDCRARGAAPPHFTNVSAKAGILSTLGYGLGVVATDVNRDGRPDIYVSNDVTPNDVLYVNSGDGTFTDRRPSWFRHTSLAGMGVDVADFNNDGWPDVLQADMMPSDPARRKRMSGFMTLGGLEAWRQQGLLDDYAVNTLQLSQGVVGDSGNVLFSDIAAMAGVAHTDWSWAPLFADFDNDGWKDIFIGNGYPKAVNDFDYQTAMFAVRRRADTAEVRRLRREILARLPAYRLPNHVFRNGGGLTFTDRTIAWGLDAPSVSYGAAYGDLNNDGALDLVVNNIDAPAFIYENVLPPDDRHHSLTIRLEGEGGNRRGIGAHVALTAGGVTQHVYHTTYRGFMSTMDDRVHFGMGTARRADTLAVTWPDGRRQVLAGVEADRLLVLRQRDATEPDGAATAARVAEPDAAFQPVHLGGLSDMAHQPGTFVDYGVQPLLPYMISRQGPPLAVADVDGDGLDDVFVGGRARAPGRLLLQRSDGRFVAAPWAMDSAYEDWGALFFDANGDGRPDLYVASGGYHLVPESPLLQDRLYVNAGGGRFVRDTQALPVMVTSTAAVAAGDFNADGRPDLFVGGRLTPRAWPQPTRSHVLRNDGAGKFSDVTAQVAPELVQPGGMITSAVWVDFDGDGRQDLVTAGEWMPVRFFHNDGAHLRDVTRETRLPPLRGWWYSLAAGDVDGDGRPDLIAGNLGLNSAYTASRERPLGVYAADFAGNGTMSVVLTTQVGGTEVPFHGLVPLGREIFPLAVKYTTYASFATASMRDAFGDAALRQALHYQADTLASMVLLNTGRGTFRATALPELAQVSPIRAIVMRDVDGDGRLDAIVAGNLYDAEPNTPRVDAGNGLWLRGDGHGGFAAVPPRESGFLAPLNASGLAVVRTAGGPAVIVANTTGPQQVFRLPGAKAP